MDYEKICGKYLTELSKDWKLDKKQLCLFLGYDETKVDYVEKILKGQVPYSDLGHDFEARMTYSFKIKSHLSSKYKSLEDENKWLQKEQKSLGNKSPLELMLSGNRKGFQVIRCLVDKDCGH